MKIKTVDIHGKEHPTYAGVLNAAHKKFPKLSIKTQLIQAPLAENNLMAIVHASVRTPDGKFEGIGDATPKNVNSMIAPHIVRMAETRAKGRALRDALNIAEALAEEMGDYKKRELDEGDALERSYKENGCPKCGAEMKISSKGSPYCSALCWKGNK